ncbi:serine hydrolase domain-containing protein [Modicisalibacter xianhensis]|uniref:CubicO group peptidase, beta-lactamase class C family n=1 Tax=Modicisalibacter xianhensis TaxID=442341 RepID=A0A1I3ABY2_9GAMM|nr:serine hydrolase [Halomonas xianhensis]SFH47420.1 CubicO group peptidase, beta-lactamase class C family [Halomonas xianhensis]
MPVITRRLLSRHWGLCCLLAGGVLIAPVAWGQDATPGLPRSAIDDATLRAAALPRLHSLVVAHQGEKVIEYTAKGESLSEPANIKSLAKTLMSAMVGIAIQRGVIEGVDQPIVDLLDTRIPDEASPRIDNITVGNLLSMQAGLERTSGPNYGAWVASDNWIDYVLTRPFVAEPGGRMLYSTGNTHLLSAALTLTTGRDTHALAQDWLGEPLDIAIPPWTQDPQGIYMGGNEMALSPLAILRFGEMYRQGGTLDDERILSREWIEASWTPRTRSVFNHDQYGYGWFITELAGEDVYYGWGYAGQMLYIIPEVGLSVVMTSNPTPPSPGQSYLEKLEAIVAEVLIPAAQDARFTKS